jgi:adenylate cyclase
MTIRLKILALSTVLLAILCVALFVSLRLQESVHEEIGGITDYHIPITALISEIDVATDDYELTLSRLLRQESATPDEASRYRERERALMVTINDSFDKAESLITKAVADPRNDLSDRLAFAQMLGTFAMLRRDAAPMGQVGLEVIDAQRRGDLAGARRLMTEFARFEGSLGPDLAAVRRTVARLTEDATLETLGRQRQVEQLSLAAFLVAAVFGLGVAGVMATRLAGGLRRLVAGAQAVEQGTFGELLPVRSRDEIGQLTRAFNHMVAELRTKERIKDTFGKYIDPRIVAGLIATTGDELDTAERRMVTVFFSDIKGFSGLSEELTAAAIAKLLNRYFTIATETIRSHNGVIDKYIGDSVMAFWSPPFSPGDDHAADGCRAALAQQTALAALRQELPDILGLRRQVPEFTVRMGLATGEVVVGTIGAPTAKSFTVIGDTVNLASRLEGINKVYGTRIVVAEDTFRLAQSTLEARELDLVTVAGKTEPVRIFEVMADAATPQTSALRERYAEALACYRRRELDAAEDVFRSCLEIVPDDGPSGLFLTRLATLRAAPLPPDWDGVWRMTEK